MRFLVRIAGQPLGDGIDVFDVARSVDRDDGVGDRRERHLRALFFLQRLRFRSLAVRHVGERSRHPLRLALLAQDRAAAQPEPAIAAAGNAQPGLEIERIAAREVFAQRREQLAAVARVHPAQERAGGFAKRARRVAEQGLESRRAVQLAPFEAPVPDAVVGAADDVVEPLLARAQRREKSVLLADQPLRAHQRNEHQHDAERDRDDHQRRLDLSRGARERGRERALECRQCAIERAQLDELRLEIAGVTAAAADQRVDLLCERFDPAEQRIGFGPDPHATGHEADRTKAAEQHDHAVDVGRIVARIQQAGACDVEIGERLFELDARHARAGNDASFLDVAVEVILVARLRVLLERLDRCILRVRPRAFGGDVGAEAADHLQARRAEHEQQQHDRHERPYQPDKA